MLRKMLRDMKLNKTQFISIFLMAFLGVFIYAGVISEGYGLEKTADDFYEATNMADIWIYGTDFTRESMQEIEKLEQVTGVERRLTLKAIADFDNSPTIKLHFAEKYDISQIKLMEGEKFSIDDKDGIWLDQLFAKAKGIKVGDYIGLNVNGLILDKKIKGLVMSPEYVYSAGEDDIVPVRTDYGFGVLSYQAFPEEIPITYTELLVTTKEKPDAALEALIDKALDGKYGIYITRDNFRSYMQFNEEMKEHKAIGRIFPVMFLAVAVLTIVTTMARIVNNQRTQIGVLMAIGFRRKRILFHYVSYGLWVSLAGAVLGVIIGPLLLPYVFYGPMQTVYTLPEWKSTIPISVLFMVLATILGCTLATYLTCRNVLNDTPAQSLRPKAPKSVKHSILDRTKLWSRLSFHSQWNLRDVIRCKGRSLMAIVGVMGCSALLICGFGLQDTMDHIVEWNYEVINQYETQLDLQKSISNEQIDYVIKQINGESVLEGAVELKAKGKKKSGEITVLDEVDLIRFVDKNRNFIELPQDSIAISYKMAENMDLKVGDELSWHFYQEEKWNNSVIGAIYRTPFTQGIAMYRPFYEKLGYSYHPSMIITAQKDISDVLQEGEDGIEKISGKEALVESYNTLAQAMDVMVYTLIFAAIVLVVVVIYNLGVLSFTERQRELSTLKVMGFKSRKLRRLLLTQNIWLTVIGLVPGIQIGIFILSYIFQFLGDVFDFIIVVEFGSYVYSILGTLILSAAVNRLFSKKVKSIDMVSSLKGVE
ncbi:MAG: antimicrobial peptide transporter, permease component [Firmicutes bacterium]|nr:antimicrobial peptide transporter, permease component [Bacillota bacterium]